MTDRADWYCDNCASVSDCPDAFRARVACPNWRPDRAAYLAEIRDLAEALEATRAANDSISQVHCALYWSLLIMIRDIERKARPPMPTTGETVIVDIDTVGPWPGLAEAVRKTLEDDA